MKQFNTLLQEFNSPPMTADNHKQFAGLIVDLMTSRTRAHLLHLQSKSYAQHVALEQYYDQIVDLIDSLTETYQGHYSVITEYPDPSEFYAVGTDPVSYFKDLLQYFQQDRSAVPAKTDLQNIADEIQSLIARTYYKLKNLA